ncbi:hypothetical protein CSC94_12825 [Zhengella mangrovi]|uniref:Uncharacterized protein n=1 Tax=Zhengella mangrovi TaxID=1982044 RepID=A0A2G1QM09_9HYPH|nr:hypothetical protein [Zhengella mangrovi]PHP66567.1 hypothetical protein CSC94_12825 [Zhengella mangrovi]
MGEVLKEWWGVIAAFVAAAAWFFRLEARGIANEKEIRRLWQQRKEDLANAAQSREETAAMLREIRHDIKTLISRNGGQ